MISLHNVSDYLCIIVGMGRVHSKQNLDKSAISSSLHVSFQFILCRSHVTSLMTGNSRIYIYSPSLELGEHWEVVEKNQNYPRKKSHQIVTVQSWW